MNTTLWILQILLAVVLMASALFCLFVPKEKLASKMSWITAYSDNMRYFICTAKIAGAAGLVLPMSLNIIPVLTPIAALAIAIFMGFAVFYHIQKKEYKDLAGPIIFMLISLLKPKSSHAFLISSKVFIRYGRLRRLPKRRPPQSWSKLWPALDSTACIGQPSLQVPSPFRGGQHIALAGRSLVRGR